MYGFIDLNEFFYRNLDFGVNYTLKYFCDSFKVFIAYRNLKLFKIKMLFNLNKKTVLQ